MADLFEGKAKDWDSDDRRKELAFAVGSAILENISFNSQMHVMDFGAGTGLISSQIAPLVKKITAVDVSKAMLDKLFSKKDMQNKVKIVCRDIINDSLEAQFDLIVSAMAMHHVKDLNKLIERFKDNLKPGAMVALADLDKEDGTFHTPGTQGIFHEGLERDEFKEILEKHGFKDIKFITAHKINKEDRDYTVFLALAKK